MTRHEAYDDGGRVRSVLLRAPSGQALQCFSYDYGLDLDGEPTGAYHSGFALSVRELDGTRVAYGYDDLDRLVSATRTGTNPYAQSYGYNANDNRIRVTADGVTATAEFDGANQLTRQGSTAYAYDRNGNMTATGGNTLSYDATNRWTGGTVSGQSVGFGYDGAGRRVSRTIGTGGTESWYDRTGLRLETGTSGVAYTRGPGGELLSRAGGGACYTTARTASAASRRRTGAPSSRRATGTDPERNELGRHGHSLPLRAGHRDGRRGFRPRTLGRTDALRPRAHGGSRHTRPHTP